MHKFLDKSMRWRIFPNMGAIEHIRKAVLGVTQADLGAIVGVTQATVSRWENGEGAPSLDEMARIRTAAKARGIDWDDAWFFAGSTCDEADA